MHPSILLLMISCKDDPGKIEPISVGHPPEEDSGGSDDTGEVACVEDAAGEIDPAAEWIMHDSDLGAEDLYNMSQPLLASYEGYEGTYDLHEEPMHGAASFELGRPGLVVGFAVRWTALPDDETAVPLQLWSEYGRTGLYFHPDESLGTPTRCLDASSDGEWIEYALDEPVRFDEPGHIFAGYTRDPEEPGPELLLEDSYAGDWPYRSSAMFPNVDPVTFNGGTTLPFYIWQVRLAVVLDEEVEPAHPWFVQDEGLYTNSYTAWSDYNFDGAVDVMTEPLDLWLGDGEGGFERQDGFLDLDGAAAAGPGAWGDFDNDGCPDFFAVGEPDVLLWGHWWSGMEEVTEEMGLADSQDEFDCRPETEGSYVPGGAPAWLDVDLDGFLDLYVAGGACTYSDDDGVETTWYFQDRLFHNNEGGWFDDWSDRLEEANLEATAIATVDYDLDGDTDLYISSGGLAPNRFLVNNGDGTFTDVARENGTAGTFDEDHDAWGSSYGAVFGDVDNDGDFDLVVASRASPATAHYADATALFVNDGSGIYTEEAEVRGLWFSEAQTSPALLDADNDGDLDLLITSQAFGYAAQFYENDGAGYFSMNTWATGAGVENTAGAIAVDVEADGDQDIVSVDTLVNVTDSGNHWIEVYPLGNSVTPADGLGTTVVVTATTTSGELRLLRHSSGASGFGSQDGPYLHFGLGDADIVDSVELTFAPGRTVTLEDVDVDQRIVVFQEGDFFSNF